MQRYQIGAFGMFSTIYLKDGLCFYLMKTYKGEPPPLFMIEVVQEFLELLYWTLQKVLEREGITMLQWAFMQRALVFRDGVPFRWVLEVTGESKDNVRRAAASLRGFANVVVDPEDRRARRFVLTKRGKRRANQVTKQFEREVLNLLGARDWDSNRAEQFKRLLWDATAYLAPGDLASNETIARWIENRKLIPDDSLRFVEDDSDPRWSSDEPVDDQIPW